MLLTSVMLIWLSLSLGDAAESPVQPLNIGLMLHFDNVKNPQEMINDIVSSMDTKISSTSITISINITTQVLTMNDNSISNVLALCEQFVQPDNSIHALIVSHPPNKPFDSPDALSYACEFYKIPIISISTQDPVYSEKALHSTFLRTVSPDIQQTEVWADILHDPVLRYSKVVLIYPNNYNGQQLYEAALNSFTKVFVTISKRVNFTPGLTKSEAEIILRNLKTSLRVFIFYGSKEDAGVIFSAALNVGMLDKGYFWLVSQSAASVAPIGTVFVQLKRQNDIKWHLNRAVRSIYAGLCTFLRQQDRLSPFNELKPLSTCNSRGWIDGKSLYRNIRDQKLDTTIQFNMNGDPTYSEYDLFVKQSSTNNQLIGTWKQGVGGKDSQIDLDEKLLKSRDQIVWLGGGNALPEGVSVDGDLVIVTVEDNPFVFVSDYSTDAQCNNNTHSLCIQYDPRLDRKINKCCYGYCIQLLRSISTTLNFSYTLQLVKDGKFGTYQIITKANSTKSERVWVGAIGELVRKEADAVFASVTINHDRSSVVDFTNPYKPQGLSIVVKRQKASSSLSSFVQPFNYTLWILIFLSVHFVALILYLLDRFSPFAKARSDSSSRDNTCASASNDTSYPLSYAMVAGSSQNDDEDDGEEALNLSSALWFAYGVLLNSGIGGTPRSFAARVLGMVWAGFAMIIVASYTANLAAHLVLERPESEISGINDARMRNPSDNYRYGTVKDSAVENYFRRKVEMTNMYHFMQNYSYTTQNEALKALKDGSIQAFIWDSAQLDYETSKDCDLMMVGDTFDRSGLAVALQKDSPWTEKISMEILKMRETGEMEQMDRDWIIINSCELSDNKPTTLGIDSMAGIFITVAIGVLLGGVCIVIERVYYRHFDTGGWVSEQQKNVARNAFEKWRVHTEEKREKTPGFSTEFMNSHGKTVESESGSHFHFGSHGTSPPSISNNGPINRSYSPNQPSSSYGGACNTALLRRPNALGHQMPMQSIKEQQGGGSSRGSPLSPPTPPIKTSSLERNQNNRVVQFKQPIDTSDDSAAYVDV